MGRRKFKFQTGDHVYYCNPRTRDTIPAVVISADNDCIVQQSRIRICGNWPSGDRILWVNCGNVRLQKEED